MDKLTFFDHHNPVLNQASGLPCNAGWSQLRPVEALNMKVEAGCCLAYLAGPYWMTFTVAELNRNSWPYMKANLHYLMIFLAIKLLFEQG